MAEDKETPQTTGTVLERLGTDTYGTFYNPNWSAIGQAVQTGTLSRADVNTLSTSALSALGSSEYNKLFGIQTGGSNPPQCLMSPLAMELQSLGAMKAQLTGTGNAFLRMLIDQRVQSLRMMYSKFSDKPSIKSNISDMLPDWMKPLITQGTRYENPDVTLDYKRDDGRAGRGGNVTRTPNQTGGIFGKLRPLSAQDELSLEQQEFLAGYLAWAKSGFPSGYGMGGFGRTSRGDERFADMIQNIASKQGAWWQEYQRQSQSLFPTANLQTTRKRTFEQR